MVNRMQYLLGAIPEATSYTDYFEVEAVGDTFIVPLATALALERQLETCSDNVWIEFRDVFGARQRLPARAIYRITESTRETRAALRAFRRARQEEATEDEDPFASLD
jgi:hypothetical protein